MRIIAGEKRGFVLASPNGEATRPTLGRVRESVFSIIGSQIMGARVVDLFAGAGSLGLEALSRGADHCTFIETDRQALDALFANIKKLRYETQSTVEKHNAVTWAAAAALPPVPHVIFADPPYHLDFAQKTLNAVASNLTLPSDSLLVLQHGKRDSISPATCAPLAHIRTEKYGETIVQFFTLNP